MLTAFRLLCTGAAIRVSPEQFFSLTNNVAQYILDQSLKGLQTTQDEINKQVADMLNSAASKQQQAADTQLQAANTMLEASYRWIKGNQVAV